MLQRATAGWFFKGDLEFAMDKIKDEAKYALIAHTSEHDC
jgi:hypothetical protein